MQLFLIYLSMTQWGQTNSDDLRTTLTDEPQRNCVQCSHASHFAQLTMVSEIQVLKAGG